MDEACAAAISQAKFAALVASKEATVATLRATLLDCEESGGGLESLKSITLSLPVLGPIGRILAHFEKMKAGQEKSRNPLIQKALRLVLLEAEEGIEPSNDGFANLHHPLKIKAFSALGLSRYRLVGIGGS
jgi:hypothetical protein